ncbi:MAG: type II secretion system protein GspE [Actinobacteria bacterium]|jgi:type IV pilus assembly protein PilB|nr:MAG: type II secretion system protein GspE [Actinomycetota bacterium]
MSANGDSGLGNTLVESGIITTEQLESAIHIQKLSGQRLKDVLIGEGYTTRDQLKQFISEHVDIPYVKLSIDLIDPEAVKLVPANVARNNIAIPVNMVGDILTMAVSCPFDTAALDMLAFASGYKLEPILSDEEDILEAIEYFFKEGGLEEEVLSWDEDKLEVVDRYQADPVDEVKINEGPVVKLANLLLSRAIKEGASDIHIEPQEGLTRIRYRIDGVLVEAKILPLEIHNALVSRVKVIANLDITERRLPQDGRFFVKYKGKDVDFRIATAPTIHGESVIIRVLDQSNAAVSLADLGFEDDELQKLMRILEEPHGFILVTGPTGSGKTTTLYAMLNEISDISRKVITIEDPVEYRLNTVSQITVNNKVGLDFATILRSVLRQDPDVILVGEIRDRETASIAVQAALTGHLLFSTLHTTGAPETLPRLIEMGIEPYYIREVVRVIIAQRLARKLCPRCKEKYAPDAELLSELGLDGSGHYAFYRPSGCKYCNNIGYKGRTSIYEVMPMSKALTAMMSLEVTPEEIKEKAVEQGMSTMWFNAVRKVAAGITSAEEIKRTIPR